MLKVDNREVGLPNSLKKITGEQRADVSKAYEEAVAEKIRREALEQLKNLCPDDTLFLKLSAKVKFLSDSSLEHISRLVASSPNAAAFLTHDELRPGLIADLLEKCNDTKLAMLFSLSSEASPKFIKLKPKFKIKALENAQDLADLERLILDYGIKFRSLDDEEPYLRCDPGVRACDDEN